MVSVERDVETVSSTGRWSAFVACESTDLIAVAEGYKINGLVRQYAGGSTALVTDTGQVLRLVESSQVWKEW